MIHDATYKSNIPARKSGWIEINLFTGIYELGNSRSQERVDRNIEEETGKPTLEFPLARAGGQKSLNFMPDQLKAIPARKSGWIEMGNRFTAELPEDIPARKSGWIEIHCHAYVTASCHSRSQERVDRNCYEVENMGFCKFPLARAGGQKYTISRQAAIRWIPARKSGWIEIRSRK